MKDRRRRRTPAAAWNDSSTHHAAEGGEDPGREHASKVWDCSLQCYDKDSSSSRAAPTSRASTCGPRSSRSRRRRRTRCERTSSSTSARTRPTASAPGVGRGRLPPGHGQQRSPRTGGNNAVTRERLLKAARRHQRLQRRRDDGADRRRRPNPVARASSLTAGEGRQVRAGLPEEGRRRSTATRSNLVHDQARPHHRASRHRPARRGCITWRSVTERLRGASAPVDVDRGARRRDLRRLRRPGVVGRTRRSRGTRSCSRSSSASPSARSTRSPRRGLVVTYTTSGIFNFAQGAMGMFCAFIYWELKVNAGSRRWSRSLITVLVSAPLFGAVIERVLMRRLTDRAAGGAARRHDRPHARS